MPAGLTIYNTGNTVQVDENWKNYGFRQKFSVTATVYDTSPPNPAGFNGMPYSFSIAGSPQLLVACKAAVLLPVKQHSYYSGGSWNLNWLFMRQIGVTGTVSETVEFYVFDQMDSSYSNVGLEVFNAAGERVFHSDAPVMRVGSDSNPGFQGCNTYFYGDSGRTYVPLILSNPFVAANIGGGLGNRHFSYGNRSLGSVITGEGTPQLGAFASLFSSADIAGLYAAIDVTDLS